MDKFVDYKEVPFGDKDYWNIEYKPVWDVEGRIAGWRPKATVYARGGRAEVVLKDGYVYIDDNIYNAFEDLKPVEKRGLYDLYIENHMDIPDTISKDSPCYKQFMEERERK